MSEDDVEKLFQYAMRRHSIAPNDLMLLLNTVSSLSPKKRAYQAALLRQTLKDAALVAQACGWRGVAVLRDGEVFVDQDGDASPSAGLGHQGRVLEGLFQQRGLIGPLLRGKARNSLEQQHQVVRSDGMPSHQVVEKLFGVVLAHGFPVAGANEV